MSSEQPSRPARRRGTLLLLSHCVPVATGGTPRARAWQLLQMVDRSYRVHLACVWDGPTSLEQWRAVRGMTEDLALKALHPTRRLAGRVLGLVDCQRGRKLTLHGALTTPAARWSRLNAFDAVLCTDPSLWSDAAQVRAPLRMVDLHGDALPAVHRQVARQFDLVIVSRRAATDAIRDSGGKALWLPENVTPSAPPDKPDLRPQVIATSIPPLRNAPDPPLARAA